MNKKLLQILLLLSCSITLAMAFYIHSYSTKPDRETVITNIMQYQMPDVIKRCQKDFGYSDEDITILEKELKRYLILCTLKEENEGVDMYSTDVDNLWHSFILFTKDYASFCDTNAGHFIHHIPKTDSNSPQFKKAGQGLQSFTRQYEKVFHEEPHAIWFLDACEKVQS